LSTLTFHPPIAPSPGTSAKPEIKVLRAEFGDGYSQATPDGLNHIRQNIELKWEILELDDRNEILAFLEGQAGTKPFHYALPGDSSKLWTCSEWSTQTLPAQLYSLTATLRQNFGAAVS
jgi:phage-related protein